MLSTSSLAEMYILKGVTEMFVSTSNVIMQFMFWLGANKEYSNEIHTRTYEYR